MAVSIDTIKVRYGIVGFNPKLISALEIAVQVAPTEVTVLIVGENGTGKDVFSRIIHQNSRRKHEAFMAINTGAIPEGTMDSELFGHEKGAFTGAVDSRKGYFEEVDGGTLFLDEIGEMPMATQARLLRLLENKEYLRVGSSKVRHAEVRVLAATNKNLIDLIRKGKFREDLYFRLNTVVIQVPPLRERGQDLELLFQYFADEFAIQYKRSPLYLTPEAAEILYSYHWPGNVRELRNFVEKLTVLVDSEMITPNIIQEHLSAGQSFLPSLVVNPSQEKSGGEGGREDIEMLYKMFFKLRDDVDELREVVRSFVSGGSSPIKSLPERAGGYRESRRELEDDYVVVHTDDYHPEQEVDDSTQEVHALEESLDLDRKKKELIIRALDKHGNNRKKAAEELGISERTLYRNLNKYGLNKKEGKES